MAIEHVEGLEHFTLGAIAQAAIGQYAVYIEDHQLYALRAIVGRLKCEGIHQITFARVRSWMCSAPTSLPWPSVTST